MKTIWLCLFICALLLSGCARSAPSLDPFIEACGKGDVQTVQEMLKKNPDLAKASRPDGYTALHEAIMQSRDGLVPILLEAGANPNQVKGNGNQPLHAGVHKLQPETIKLLVEKGAQVDGRAPNGDTPLIIAAGIPLPATLKVLLDLKANPNLQNTETGAFALFHAATSGQGQMVPDLLEKGADPNLALKDGSTALHVAVAHGRLTVVKQLLEREPDLNPLDKVNQTPLTVAVGSGQLAMIDLLVGAGADPNIGTTMQQAQGKPDILAHLKAGRSKAPKGGK